MSLGFLLALLRGFINVLLLSVCRNQEMDNDLLSVWGESNDKISLVAQMVKNPPAMQETWVWSLGTEDPLEKGIATHSSILAWEFHGQTMRSQRAGYDWATKTFTFNDKCTQTAFIHWLPFSSIHLTAVYYKLCNALNSLVLNENTLTQAPYVKKKATKINGGGEKGLIPNIN